MIMTLTAKREQEIRERVVKATPGPWVCIRHKGYCIDEIVTTNPEAFDEKQKSDYVANLEPQDGSGHIATTSNVSGPRGVKFFEADSDFIAHARQDVPDLLAEIERLRARYDKMRAEYCEVTGNALEALIAAKAEIQTLRNFAVMADERTDAAKAENERLREQVRAGIVNVFENLNDGWWSMKIDYGRGDAARKHMRALADILYGDRAALSKPQEDKAAMTNPPEWAIKQVENALDNQANNESIVQSFARALVETAERVERQTREADAQAALTAAKAEIERLRETVSPATIKVLRDYEHVHLMLEEGKAWPDAREYLASNGWRLTSEPYEYWSAYAQQTMILALGDIVSAARTALGGDNG